MEKNKFEFGTWESKIDGLEGIIIYRRLTPVRRFEVIEQLNLEFGEDDKVILKDKVSKKEQVLIMEDIVKTQIVSVELKARGEDVTDINQLQYFNEYMSIIGEISNKLLGGISLGKD